MVKGSAREFKRIMRRPLDRVLALRRLAAFHAQPRSLDEVVDAAMDFHTRGQFKIKAQQLRSEILALAERVAAIRPRVILEIGTARGGTLLLWSQLASELVISCDLSIPHYRRALYARYAPPGSRCRVEVLEGDSHAPRFRAQVAATLAGQPVDYLFIDGDHTVPGVCADWSDYRGFVRPGGLVAFHDIAERQPFESNQVQQLWRRIRQQHRIEELIEDRAQCGFGIGLVYL